jgi:hypothetical protein
VYGGLKIKVRRNENIIKIPTFLFKLTPISSSLYSFLLNRNYLNILVTTILEDREAKGN